MAQQQTRPVAETHQCPIMGCRTIIPTRKAMCRQHWILVPRPLREEVKRTYGAGDREAHIRAYTAAIRAVNGLRLAHDGSKEGVAGLEGSSAGC